MSEDANTQLAQAAYEAFGRGDIPALAEAMADDIVWISPGDPAVNPTAGTYTGKETVLGWFGKLGETFEFDVFEPREFIAQRDRVVSLVYVEATARSTGKKVISDEAHVWTFRDGKISHFQIYLDTEAGAAALSAG